MAYLLLLIFSPMQINAASEQCQSEWNQILLTQITHNVTSEYYLMFQFSGFLINNVGNYDGCNRMGNARYVFMVITTSPLLVQTFCGPISCTKEDYYTTFFPFYVAPPVYIQFPHKYQEDHYREYETGAVCMIVFISIISAIVAFSTVFDFAVKGDFRETYLFKVFNSFSLINNVTKLLTTRSQDRLGQKDPLESLNAVRVFSLGWVLMGHVFLFYISTVPLVNWEHYIKEFKRKDYILVYTAFFAVDTFFWMSGLLMAYLFLLEFEKIKHFPLFRAILVYVHRILRITPVYMFCLLFFWSMMPYLGNGPFWFDITNTFNKDCHKYWWSNLLYINNFVPHWKSSDCLGQTWYLANDMQFFFISPIILLFYIYVDKLIVWLTLIGLNILGVVTAAVVAHHYNLNPVILSADNGSHYFNYYYVKPYCRIPPYAFGIACGLVLYSYRQFKQSGRVYDKIALMIGQLFDNRVIRLVLFGLGVVVINILIFVQYDTYRHPGDEMKYHHWSNNQRYSFIALERFVYGLALSLVLLPMILGYIRYVARFMSLYVWSVIARITFVMYLIHQSMIEIVLRSTKTSIEFDNYNCIRDTVWIFLLSLFCAIPIVLGIEMPALNLEKLLLSNFKRKPEDTNNKLSLLDINRDDSSRSKELQ